MSLGLVVFSNINYYYYYLFIIYDVILTAFRIILSTWLYNYAHNNQLTMLFLLAGVMQKKKN